MEALDTKIIDLLDITLSEEELNNRINHTHCLKSLMVLLNLKKRRISNGLSKKIVYPIYKIYNHENEDFQLQCAVLNTALLVTENSDKGVLQVVTYLNSQLNEMNNFFNFNIATKVAGILNEIISFCRTRKQEYLFQENISTLDLEMFLLHVAVQKQNVLRIYVLSTVIPNYMYVLNELQQVLFLYKTFQRCETIHNLDAMCIVVNYIDEKIVLTNRESVLMSDNFWQYLENCISYDSGDLRKQAIFLLKKWIQAFHNTSLKYKIPYLQIADVPHELSEKMWQHFFILLDTSKEKQLHLILPSLTLLNSLKHINILWQICVYKNLLAHTQNVVVYIVASHIIQEKICFPQLNKCFLSAINKNEYSVYSTDMFTKLPAYCNGLDSDIFSLFCADVLAITWTPTAAWRFFSNVFSKKLTKNVTLRFVESIYKILKQLPHIYIRNGCISTVLNYYVSNYNWSNNFDEILQLLVILKDYDNDLFINAISDYIDKDCVDSILHEMKQRDILDRKLFVIFIQILKKIKYERKLPIILENTKQLNETLLFVYANFFENYSVNEIEKFALQQMIELNKDYTEMFLSVVEKLMKSHVFCEIMYQKVYLILNQPHNYNQTAVFISLNIILKFCEKRELKKYMNKNLKEYFDSGKTDDSLYSFFLKLYFLTENYVEVSFLEDVFNNQSDLIISKMFECISTINFHENYPDIISLINFIKQGVNILPNFTKSRSFKIIVFNYVNCIFSISFLETLSSLKMIDVITLATDSLLVLSESFPMINYHLSQKIKETIFSLRFPNSFLHILIPTTHKLLLSGMIIKKDDRVEYYICQEIYEKFESLEDNPNMIKISTRMSSLESILEIVNKNPKYADDFAAGLIEEYRIYFGKRYFPDSQIHIQKLRIVQTLLTIHPFIKNQRPLLIDLIVESFCTEIHQPCVKQLMQWLLLSLLKGEDSYFDMIKSKIDTTCKTQPSSIVAFIGILLHLTLCKEESYWLSTIEAFIPWSMGAHFKLRVYSQAAIKKLLEEAKQKYYQNFLTKYGYLETSIDSVIKTTGRAFHDTLKSDELIFSTFIPERDYSLESIYVDIPKLNGVTKTEWENILRYKFNTHENINIFNKYRIFSDSVQRTIESDTKEIISEDTYEHIHNIQRKITPWKSVEVSQENSRPVSDFILIASLVDKSTNLGGLSRTCEVFGVKQLVLNDTKILNDKDFRSLSMSSEDWIDAVEVKITDLKNYIFEIRSKGYSVIGAEQTSESICLDKYKFNKKTALILGNEKEGIPSDIIPILDECIEIPQFGMVRSLNVHVAGATFIWEYAKQHLVQ